MDWFASNPNQNATFLQRSIWNAHVWGRQQFAKSYARGGIASIIFAPTRKEMLRSPWRKKYMEGSSGYMARLEKLQELHPNDPGIMKAIAAGKNVKPRRLGGVMTAGSAALGAYYMLEPALTTKGDAVDKARAVGKGAAGYVGWEVGAAVGLKAGAGIGASIGATIGSVIPIIGTTVGATVGAGIGIVVGFGGGGLAGSGISEKIYDTFLAIPDRMVDRERARRGLNWGQHTAAFQTQRAHTMRQQSLALMNRGAMSSRSLMGQEAMFIHR